MAHRFADESFNQAQKDAKELKPWFMPFSFQERILRVLLKTYQRGYSDGLMHGREIELENNSRRIIET